MKINSQPNVSRFPKVLKASLWLMTLVLLCLGALVGGGWYLQKKFPEKLKALVHEKSHGQYQLEFDKLTLSLLNGSLYLENLKLKPDTQAYKANLSGESANYLIQANIQKVRISGVKIIRYLRKKELILNKILIEHPDLVLYQMRDTLKKDTVEKGLYDQVPDFLKGAKLGSIDVNELSFSKRKIGALKDSVNTLKGVSFSIDDMDLNPSALLDTNRVWFSKNIQISSNELNYTLGNGMYVLSVGKFSLSTRQKTLDMEAFSLTPQYKDFEFFQKLGKQGSRYDVVVPEIHVENFDFKKLETEGKFYAQSLSIANGKIDIFSDKKMPARKDNAIRNAPHLALQRLETPISIDSLKVREVELHYREFNPKSNRTGDVFFTHMGGAMTNITNDSVPLSKNHWATSHFEMNFLNQAKIKVNLNLNLISKVGEFTYKGSLGAANALVYNSILVPLAMVRVEKGYFNTITFDVKANERGSHGTVQVLYKDLKVSVLVQQNDGKVGREGLFSFLANSFLISPNNPDQGLPTRISHFTYTHSPFRSFFNLMWKSIFEGIKGNVIESKEQRKENKVLLREKKRKEKREAREEKREAKRLKKKEND